MNPVDIIARCRDGLPLSEAQIEFFLSGLTNGKVETHQAAAWLMAVRLNGMSKEETISLTRSMIDSGETVDLSSLGGIPVDKHSTGGVGDTTTLVLGPIVAAAGAKVAKMSGRGLGHTGGTLDKMEAVGINVNLSSERFLKQVRDLGIAVISQTAKLVPADGILYSLRDVTATIDSVPLIASSVMSKKLACGAQAIVLDVKYGNGAFMPDLESARELAQLMVEIGNGLGRRVRAALSTMDQPLGSAIGNALEFSEAAAVLKGEREGTALARVSSELAAEILVLAELSSDRAQAKAKVKEILSSGAALEKLREMIIAQDGNPAILEDPKALPKAPIKRDVLITEDGYLASLAAKELGMAALHLGAGRMRKTDEIDPSVGLLLDKRVGDKLVVGERLCQIHAADESTALKAEEAVRAATKTVPEAVSPPLEIAEWV